ncbi:DUF3263 domain-containing protein [Plantactinospora endophytica]|uniref:DUF3263 domain-containing protein n=1 Tax=Plantactinospora endophytica TaxID=673535 RepID=A0ABQ4DSA6_9ACTN|nr:DUF3263 domain-containing protein [Plantactinospora endophytica]GIG85347.1 hypothetical protein Pen02_02830 [Plantactinospora endophytica]
MRNPSAPADDESIPAGGRSVPADGRAIPAAGDEVGGPAGRAGAAHVPQPRSAPGAESDDVPEIDDVPDIPAPARPADPALSEREREILAFERRWWKHAGAKEQAIRDAFDLSATRYYQLLNGLLDNPAAIEAEPVLVARLRRLRAARSRNRRR